LIKLNLGNNKLSSLPPEIGNLKSLSHLFLNNNNLVNFPHCIGDLIHLKQLEMGGNELINISDKICNLIDLETLSLKSNQLTELPYDVGKLKNLKNLYLSYNKITYLPKTIANLLKLTNLDLGNNESLDLQSICNIFSGYSQNIKIYTSSYMYHESPGLTMILTFDNLYIYQLTNISRLIYLELSRDEFIEKELDSYFPERLWSIVKNQYSIQIISRFNE